MIHQNAYAASDPRPQRDGLKISVSGTGIYRVTGADLSNAGIDPAAIEPQTFRMFHLDSEIALNVAWGAGSGYVEFYAAGVDNQYTGTDVYWLYWGGAPGIRMAEVDGSRGGATTEISDFMDILTIEENHVYWLKTPGAPEADYWFWEKLTSPSTNTYTIDDIPFPVANAEDAVVTVYFQGRDDVSESAVHHTTIQLNGNDIGDATWTGGNAYAQAMTVSPGLLNSGANFLTIKSSGDGVSHDVIYFDRVRIEYQRKLAAINGRLTFFMNENQPVFATVSGFSHQDIGIYDISDPNNVKIVSNAYIHPGFGGYVAGFAVKAGQKTFFACAENAVQSPDKITLRHMPGLKDTANGADYIIITSNELKPALEKLRKLRALQGMRAKIVDIEDIYDTFSYGMFTPEAVRDFLKYAYENWTPPAPQYVLLAGDANLDYRNYYGTGKKNIVPVHLAMTEDLGLTPSDNWYACVSGDDAVPDLYIGRIPGDSPDTVTAIVNKLIYYESTKAPASENGFKNALLVADNDDPDFEALNDALAADYLPPEVVVNKVYARRYPDQSDVTDAILGFMDQGMLITSFVGHGDVTRWGVKPSSAGVIIKPADLAHLAGNDRLTFIIALDCLNGYFSEPLDYSLAEEWVMAPDKGAVACFAPSGLSYQQEHERLSRFIFSKIFVDKENRLGAITTESKIDAYRVEVSDKVLVSLNLIGDPATRLDFNRDASDLVTVHTIYADAGAGGTISPSENIPVFDQAGQKFTVTPSTGYSVSDIIVDGVSQGADDEFTFDSVVADHTIHAVFKANTQSGGGGGGCFIRAITP